MYEVGVEQIVQWIGEGDKEGVQQVMGDVGVLIGEQCWQLVVKVEEIDCLEEVYYYQYQGVLLIFWCLDFVEGVVFDDVLCCMCMFW